MTSMEDRTLAAEVRAVEDGKQARLAGDGHHFMVKGVADHDHLTYRVGVTDVAGTIVFECDHAVQLGYATQPERTTIPCKHGARCAERLEREGFLRWDAGRWVPTGKTAAVPEHVTEVVDRAHGARSNFEARCSCGWSRPVATLDRAHVRAAADAHVKAQKPMSDDDLFDMIDEAYG